VTRRGRVVFKYEDEEADGTPVGPVWIDYFGEDQVRPERSEKLEEWVRLPEARRLAEERDFEFVED
jgi:hypothetical protein